MSMIQGVGNLRAKIKHQFCGQSVGRDVMAQRFSRDVLHGNVRLAVDLSHFINRADMWMIQSRSGTRFAQNLLAGFAIRKRVRRRQLEGHIAMQSFVPRTKNYAHTTGASLIQHQVVGECLANHGEGPCAES